MLFSSKGILTVCTSSGLFVKTSPWRLLQLQPESSSRYQISTWDSSRSTLARAMSNRSLTREQDSPRLPPNVMTSMGPLHGSADIHDKITNIRGFLRESLGRQAADGLQVIMDFDLTITAPGSEQCHHMFETSSALSAELRGRLSPFLTGEIEVSSREEWWDGFHSVLVNASLSREQVAAVARGADVTLREGTAELITLLQDLGVPLLIVSAGISDIVEETLRARGLLLDNVTVRANTMHFGEDGRLKFFRESPPVHSRNKQRTAERERSYFDSHTNRRCIVVVGDRPGDADVNYGVAPDDRCLKIGFLDHSHDNPHPDLPPLPPPSSSDDSGRRKNRTSDSGGARGEMEDSQTSPQSNRRRVAQQKTERNASPSPVAVELPTISSQQSREESFPDVAAIKPAKGQALSRETSFSLEYTPVENTQETATKPATAAATAAATATGETFFASGQSPAISGNVEISSFVVENTRGVAPSPERITTRLRSILRHPPKGNKPAAAWNALVGGTKQWDQEDGTCVGIEDVLRVYCDSFDVVASGGHTMGIVIDFVRHLIEDLHDHHDDSHADGSGERGSRSSSGDHLSSS